MNKKKTIRSLLSFLLTIVLAFAQPLSTFGYIGAIIPKEDGEEAVVKEVKIGGHKYAQIQNDYLHFDICIDPKDIEALGTVCHTAPTQTFKENEIRAIGYQYIEHKVSRVKDYAGKFDKLTVDKINVKYQQNILIEDEWDGKGKLLSNPDINTYYGDVIIEYTFKENSAYSAVTFFNMEKLNTGNNGGGEEAVDIRRDQVLIDPSDQTVNWGISSITFFKNNELTNSDGNDNLSAGVYYRQDVTYKEFPKMGHASIKSTDLPNIAVNAQYYTPSGALTYMNLASGVSKTPDDAVLEVYSDSYSFAAPFVACSRNYDYSAFIKWGVEGHSSKFYPSSIEYNQNTLTTHSLEGNTGCYILAEPEHKQAFYGNAYNLWGFRNLVVGKEEETGQPTNPDSFKSMGDAPFLCVFPDGTKKDSSGKQVYRVVPVDNIDNLDQYEKKYGTCVARYQGRYYIETIGGKTVYQFADAAMGLSPTITATWKDPTNSAVSLVEDGSLIIDQNNVMLNAPTFKFYNPKDGGGLTFIGYDTKKGLLLGMDPEKNTSLVNINLPGNGVAVKSVSIDTTGNLMFAGLFKINLFVAQMEMDKLSYGMNTSTDFVCNGIHAKGQLKVPKIPNKNKNDNENDNENNKEEKDASPNVLGFGGANMKGEVNTIIEDPAKDKEFYAFEFSLSVKNLFTTQAELTLVRLNNGRLCPEHLFFDIKVTAEGVGLDIPPGTPVVTLTGGGGGIDGLASTIDGNYVAIPPVVLTLVAHGEVAKIVDGTLILKVGPSQIRLTGEDLGFKVGSESLKFVDSMYAGVFLNGKELTYEDKSHNIEKRTYRGVAFGGEMGLGLKIFNYNKPVDEEPLAFFDNTISAKIALSAETYVGNGVDEPDWCYMYIGSTGSAHCSLNIPKGVKIVPEGTSLLGAGLDYRIVAETAFQTGQGGSSAAAFFKNAKLKGGIAASASVIGVNVRVLYIFPANRVKVDGKFLKKLDEINWDEELAEKDDNQEKTDPQTISEVYEDANVISLSDPQVVELEDGEQAIVVAEANVLPVALEELSAEGAPEDPTTYSHTVKLPNNYTLDEDNLILTIIPKDSEDMSEDETKSFAESLSCPKLGQIKYVPEEFSVSDNNAGYNGWVGVLSTDDHGNPTQRGIFLSVPKSVVESAGNEGITVSANKDFTIKGLKSTPVTGIDVTPDFAKDKIGVAIQNTEAEKEYMLHTYMGKKVINENGEEQIGSDYLVDSRVLTSQDLQQGNLNLSLNESGDLAPTGDYYVTTTLSEKAAIEVVDPTDKSSETVETQVPVCSWQSDMPYHYVNTVVPEAPTNVDLELLGNEAMKGSWTKVNNADGYRVTIYQEDENGNYVDTQRGYTFTNEDFTGTEDTLPVQGLNFDEATGTYSVEMAMTVGDDGSEREITLDGETQTISENDVKDAKALTAGKTYKIGVSAFRKDSVYVGDGEETPFDRFSDETPSAPRYLPKYEPVSFTVDLTGINDDADDPYMIDDKKKWNKTLTKNADGLYQEKVYNSKHTEIHLSEFKDSKGNEVPFDKVNVTVNRLGVLDENGVETPVPLESLGNNYFRADEFDGSASYELKVSYTHDGVTDESVEYLNLDKDNIAPTITLENEVTYCDQKGSYEIKGHTEPGIKVVATINRNDPDSPGDILSETIETQADEDGYFSVKDSILTSESGRVAVLTAMDDLQNESSAVTNISWPDQIQHTVIFEDGFGNVLGMQTVDHGKDAVSPVVPSRNYYRFNGWDREFKNVQGNLRVTALWIEDKTYVIPDPNGGNKDVKDDVKDEKNDPGTTPKDPAANKQPVLVSSLKLSGISNKIAAGKKIKLEASILPENADNKTLKWSSSNTKVAMVDQNGNVRVNAKAGGKKAVISAETTDGSNLKATFKITAMKKAVKTLKLKGSKRVKVKAGKSISLKAVVKAPKGANKKLKWISSDPAIATVSSKGKVKTSKKSKKGQKVKITVMTTDGTNKKKSKTIIIK